MFVCHIATKFSKGLQLHCLHGNNRACMYHALCSSKTVHRMAVFPEGRPQLTLDRAACDHEHRYCTNTDDLTAVLQA